MRKRLRIDSSDICSRADERSLVALNVSTAGIVALEGSGVGIAGDEKEVEPLLSCTVAGCEHPGRDGRSIPTDSSRLSITPPVALGATGEGDRRTRRSISMLEVRGATQHADAEFAAGHDGTAAPGGNAATSEQEAVSTTAVRTPEAMPCEELVSGPLEWQVSSTSIIRTPSASHAKLPWSVCGRAAAFLFPKDAAISSSTTITSSSSSSATATRGSTACEDR
jgi:hypothetical protein